MSQYEYDTAEERLSARADHETQIEAPRITSSPLTATQHDRPRTLVVLDREDCGVDAFERFLADEDPDSIDLRVVVRATSSSPEDVQRAQGLLREATIAAQKHRFANSGWAIVLNPNDLEAELRNVEQFDEAVIIMPESAWPTAKSSRYRRSAKRYGALVQFDCVAE